jgi:hypothetical protein
MFNCGLPGCNALALRPLQGKVSLKAPDIKLWLIAIDTRSRDTGMPPLPPRWLLAREVATGTGRAALQRFALPSRRYLGPTSMVRARSASTSCNAGLCDQRRRNTRAVRPRCHMHHLLRS